MDEELVENEELFEADWLVSVSDKVWVLTIVEGIGQFMSIMEENAGSLAEEHPDTIIFFAELV
jgi:hypothetical protein